MASSSHGPKQPLQGHQFSFGMMHHNPSPSSSSSLHAGFISSRGIGSNDDFGELLSLPFDMPDLDGQNNAALEQRQTLNFLPSEPIHHCPAPNKEEAAMLDAIPRGSNKRAREETSMEVIAGGSNKRLREGISMEVIAGGSNKKLREGASIELANPRTDETEPGKDPKAVVKKEVNTKKGLSTSDGTRTTDPKTLRRLAQNREAARKSRLRKKAYIQQLESSKVRLVQLEQQLQRSGAGLVSEQGFPIGLDSTGAMFDKAYKSWLDEHHRLMANLSSAVQQHVKEDELQLFVNNCVAHYDEMTVIRNEVAKIDALHLSSGIWLSPAERRFMWLGDFRPSEIIKLLLHHMKPLTEQQLLGGSLTEEQLLRVSLTEQQLLGIYNLQQSTQQTEEALTQGLEVLDQSVSESIVSHALSCPSNMATYMGQMAISMNELANLEGFVRQADNLRHQTLHRLHQLLTTRQMAHCLLAIDGYFRRLRDLSSLWLYRPRPDRIT